MTSNDILRGHHQRSLTLQQMGATGRCYTHTQTLEHSSQWDVPIKAHSSVLREPRGRDSTKRVRAEGHLVNKIL